MQKDTHNHSTYIHTCMSKLLDLIVGVEHTANLHDVQLNARIFEELQFHAVHGEIQ